MQESEGGSRGFWQSRPVGTHGFEQAEDADDVGLDEVFGAVDGAVRMAFGGAVQQGAGLVLGQQAIDQRAVVRIALHKHVARITLQAGEVFRVAGVGEFVEVDDGLLGLG